MKIYVLPIVVVIMAFTGCASHYYRVDQDSVSFYLEKHDAQLVYFLSSLDEYKPHKARQISHETWHFKMPVKTEFKYFYNVDGNMYVPPCRLKEYDDLGSQNCIYIPGM